MDTENKRKTLANCKNSEFLPAAMKSRKIICDSYKKIDINSIMERFKEKYNADTKDPASVLGLITDVIGAIFTDYPEETIKLAAIAGFMTEEEAESIAPTEIFAILLECAFSERVLDFFINVENTAGSGTGGIYPALIFLRVISGAMNTPGNESQQNTNDTSESASVGGTSEKP